jgi:ATP-dependent protease Clp ATPase subunit
MASINVVGQDKLVKELSKIVEIFKESGGEIRPHFILTGESGSGKSHTIKNLAEEQELGFVDINAAQLTKEGTSGNSLSKALAALGNMGGKPAICFVDEFDKLFISGNSNDSCAHETTTGVQNEFLKVLESEVTSVYADYGKYTNINTKHVLFVFAGAFNGEADINLDRLRELGVKTEFLGRVGLVFNTKVLALEDLFAIVDKSALLDKYCALFVGVTRDSVADVIKKYLEENYTMNTLGARLINTLVHQYFIKGSLDEPEGKEVSFKKKLSLTS